MDIKQIKSILTKHKETICKMCDLLQDNGVPAQDGEIILAHLAGMSAGMRQVPLDDGILQTLASSWEWMVEHDPV